MMNRAAKKRAIRRKKPATMRISHFFMMSPELAQPPGGALGARGFISIRSAAPVLWYWRAMRALELPWFTLLLLDCAAAPTGCANTSNDVPPSPSAQAAAPGTSAAAPASPPKPSGAEPAPAGARMTDRIPTSQGELAVTPIMHGTVLLEHAGKQIYIDPWSQGKFDA